MNLPDDRAVRITHGPCGMEQHRDDDRREDTPHFTKFNLKWAKRKLNQ